MKILLGATVALLLGALAMSWSGLKQGVTDAPPDEQRRMKQEIEELKLNYQRLKTDKEVSELRSPNAAVQSETQLAELNRLKEQKDAEIRHLQEEKDAAERKASVASGETALLEVNKLESRDSELRRARQISQALLMAKVKEYQEDPNLGDFVVMEIVRPEQVQPGVILAIRKNNTGILGQIKVTEVTADGAIGSPLPGFGPVKPQPGDELIVPPQI